MVRKKTYLETKALFGGYRNAVLTAVRIDRHMQQEGATIAELARLSDSYLEQERIFRCARWLGYPVNKHKDMWRESVPYTGKQ